MTSEQTTIASDSKPSRSGRPRSRYRGAHERRVQTDDLNCRVKVFQFLGRARTDIDHSLAAAAFQEISQEGIDLMLMDGPGWRVEEVGIVQTNVVVRGKSSVHGKESGWLETGRRI